MSDATTREAVERLARYHDWPSVHPDAMCNKTARTLRALMAERDAAFAAGQEDMRDRAAEAVWDAPSATDDPHGEAEAIIRALPIKPRP